MNEGLSHLLEDIYSIDDNEYMTETGLENPARIAAYFRDVSNTCVTCGTSLAQRGGSYLFMRYLYEQGEQGNLSGVTSGKEFLQNMVQSDQRGIDNVVQAAFGSEGTEADFHNIFGMFGLAIYLSNTDQVSDDRLEFLGVDLRATQDDNRGTVLNGPAIQEAGSIPYLDTISGNTINFIQLNGEDIVDAGGSLEVEVGSDDVDLKAYLVF